MIVSVIIPVFNERRWIGELLKMVEAADTRPYEKEIIVADDASTDGTSELLDGLPGVRVIHLPRNSGKASAIKAALGKAEGDIILIQDADLEYSPDDYGRMLAPFSDPSIHVVYGSRFMQKAYPKNMKPANWIANKVFTCAVNLLYGAGITDEGTGYKAFRADVIKSIGIKSSGFEFCPEVTAKLLKKGVGIMEVPISYSGRSKKEGKKPGVPDGIRVLWTIIKYRFSD
jgi:glycosyltransferase involved in cell wall biosynthesis